MVLKLSFSLFISQMLLCLLDEYRLNRLSCSPACFRFHPHHGAWFASGGISGIRSGCHEVFPFCCS